MTASIGIDCNLVLAANLDFVVLLIAGLVSLIDIS